MPSCFGTWLLVRQGSTCVGRRPSQDRAQPRQQAIHKQARWNKQQLSVVVAAIVLLVVVVAFPIILFAVSILFSAGWPKPAGHAVQLHFFEPRYFVLLKFVGFILRCLLMLVCCCLFVF
jgi:hypothetical protein